MGARPQNKWTPVYVVFIALGLQNHLKSYDRLMLKYFASWRTNFRVEILS